MEKFFDNKISEKKEKFVFFGSATEFYVIEERSKLITL